MNSVSMPGVMPYIPKQRFVRIDCDLQGPTGEPSYPGFWFEARQNLTNGERSELVDAIQALDHQIAEVTDVAMDTAEALDATLAGLRRKPDDAAPDWQPDGKAIRCVQAEQREVLDRHIATVTALDRERRDLVTPHIRAWNLFEAGDDGEPVPVPPPAEGGVAVLEAVEPELSQWMIVSCLNAYRLGKGLSSSMRSGGSQEPTNAPPAAGPQIPQQPSRRSRRKS